MISSKSQFLLFSLFHVLSHFDLFLGGLWPSFGVFWSPPGSPWACLGCLWVPYGVFCETLGTRRAEKTKKKHASRSHAKTGLFLPLENEVLLAWEVILAHYCGK